MHENGIDDGNKYPRLMERLGNWFKIFAGILHDDLCFTFQTFQESCQFLKFTEGVIRPCLKNKSCTRNQVMRSYEHETI